MKQIKLDRQRGSLLLEILLAVAIAAVIIGGVSSLIIVSLKSGQLSGEKNVIMGLAEEGLEAVKTIAENNWHNLYLPPDGAGNSVSGKGETAENTYYVYKKDNGGGVFSWELTKNSVLGELSANGISYARKIYIFNVTRNKAGDRQICAVSADCPDGEIDDPSTQRIKIKVSRLNGENVIIKEEYLSRWKNNIFMQSDWSEASPASEADCQIAGGVWSVSGSFCYAKHNYPDNQISCENAGGVWNSGSSTCSVSNQNDWKTYGTKESAIDNVAGKLKLKP